jgi:FkbM family methyltransferase
LRRLDEVPLKTDVGVVISTGGLRISLRDNGTVGSIGDRAAFSHVFFAGEYGFLLCRLSQGDVVIDAGANIGCFSLLASRKVGPNGLVVAVEPEPSNAACLRSNISLNGLTNVVVLERALDAVSDRTVHIVRTGTTASVEGLGATLDIWDPTAGKSRAVVRTITLDDIVKRLSINKVSAIKMDIEGSENSIFATTQTSSVLGAVKAVAVEVHDQAGPRLVQDRLRTEGYSYVGQTKPQSAFFFRSVGRGLSRPDLALKLYGRELPAVGFSLLRDSLRRGPKSDVLGVVYAAR